MSENTPRLTRMRVREAQSLPTKSHTPSSKTIGEGTPKRKHEGNQKPHVAPPTSILDAYLSMAAQHAKRFLFYAEPKNRAVLYLMLVFVGSLFADYFHLPLGGYNHRGYYWVQKHNVFNRYGPKIGWFWTLALLTPFVWLTSMVHQRSRAKALRDVVRLGVATAAWWFWTWLFLHVEHSTQKCHGALDALRSDCTTRGGTWIPGFDISGHTFLLIYSALVSVEETLAFRNWPTGPRSSLVAPGGGALTTEDLVNFGLTTRYVQMLLIAVAVMVGAWEIQLVITVFYYHTFFHKLVAAGIAVMAWFLSYKVWYPMGFPYPPMRRGESPKKKGKH